MGFPRFLAPGFTCQLWWIFSICLCCSKLPRQCWRRGWGGEGGFRGGGEGAALLTSGRINHRIIYLRALFGKTARAIDLHQRNLEARHRDIKNKLSLAFHLWAIKWNHMAQSAGSVWTCGEELSVEPELKRIHRITLKKMPVICWFEYQKAVRAGLLDCSKNKNPPIGLQAGV